MNAQAQNNWKILYRKARECFNSRLIGEAYERLTYAQRYRREAALERKLAAAQRTIEAQANRITELEVQVMEDVEHESKFDAWLSQALNEGDGVYRP